MLLKYDSYNRGEYKTLRGRKLRDIRVRIYDMSQADFAKHVLRCSAGSVSQMEHGRMEPTAKAKALLETYKDDSSIF